MKKYAVLVWDYNNKRYEVESRTDIHELAKTKRDRLLKDGLLAVIMNYGD